MTRRADWPVLLGVVSAAALAAAVFVERVMQIAPCELCLVDRWPWRAALAIALAALLLPRARGVLWVLALLAMLASVGLGVLHTGVEWQAWPSPFPSCHAPTLTGGSIADQLASLPTHAAKPCDAATYLVPGVPVSMAEANLVFSLVVLIALGLRPKPHQDRVDPGPPFVGSRG